MFGRMKGLILYYSHNNDLKALHQQCYLSKTGCEWVEGCLLSFPVSGDISHGKVWLRSGQRGSSLSFEIANQSSDQARLSSRLQKGVLLTHRAICKRTQPMQMRPVQQFNIVDRTPRDREAWRVLGWGGG